MGQIKSLGFNTVHCSEEWTAGGGRRQVSEAAKDKPAFLKWDLWSEPHIINWTEIYHLSIDEKQ